jgi:hypothetical protein
VGNGNTYTVVSHTKETVRKRTVRINSSGFFTTMSDNTAGQNEMQFASDLCP